MVALIVFLVSDQYFLKRKALAVGVITTGAGVGGVIIPFIIRGLYDNYGFSGASLLYGMFV